MNSIRSKLSYANVVSTLALIVAIGGGTTAVAISGKVGAKDLAKIKIRKVGSPPNVSRVGVKARCRKGERLLSGGAEMASNGILQASRPEGNGWRAEGAGGGFPTSGSAYALCLRK